MDEMIRTYECQKCKNNITFHSILRINPRLLICMICHNYTYHDLINEVKI